MPPPPPGMRPKERTNGIASSSTASSVGSPDGTKGKAKAGVRRDIVEVLSSDEEEVTGSSEVNDPGSCSNTQDDTNSSISRDTNVD